MTKTDTARPNRPGETQKEDAIFLSELDEHFTREKIAEMIGVSVKTVNTGISAGTCSAPIERLAQAICERHGIVRPEPGLAIAQERRLSMLAPPNDLAPAAAAAAAPAHDVSTLFAARVPAEKRAAFEAFCSAMGMGVVPLPV